MREEQHQFLSLLGQLPARLNAEQAAWVLNCQAHDVPILVGARLLKPLGNCAAKWDQMAVRVPGFLYAASTYDRANDTHLADHIVDHIEAVAFRAAAIAQPVVVECELAPIREYCGFLRSAVPELMKQGPSGGG